MSLTPQIIILRFFLQKLQKFYFKLLQIFLI